MSTALDAAKAKVNWAEKHFGDFKDIIYGRSTGIDTRTTTVRHYNLGQPRPGPALMTPPPESKLAFGDAVHQLRSTLDHIVYALVEPLTTDPRVLRTVDFPIFAEQDRFDRAKGVEQLRGLLPVEQFGAIVETQPYNRRPSSPTSDPLWILSGLDNIDKHRTILVVASRLLIKRVMVDGKVSVTKQPLVAGWPSFADPPADVRIEQRIPVVVLAETGLPCDNITVRKTWRDMIDAVKDTIDKFERFF